MSSNEILGKFPKNQAITMMNKIKRVGPIAVTPNDGMSFVKMYQNNGMQVESPTYISLGKLWSIARNSILDQYPLILSKVKGITTSLMTDGTLFMDPAIAVVVGSGETELISGRHRAAAIKLWFEVSGKSPREFEHLKIRVLEFHANSKEDIANHVKRWNESRNMTQSEKCYVDLQSWGVSYTQEDILDNAELFSKVKHSAYGKALGVLCERSVRVERLAAGLLTPENALQVGKGVYRYVYSQSDKDVRKAMKDRDILEFLFGFVQDRLEETVNMAQEQGHTNLGREGKRFIVEYLGSAYLDEETS